MLKIAVELPALGGDVGEYVADAQAIETAGADMLLVRPEAGTDAWLVLAALAPATYRVRLVAPLGNGERADRFAASIATLRRLSRGRLVILAPAAGVEAIPDGIDVYVDLGPRADLAGLPSRAAGAICAAGPDEIGSQRGPEGESRPEIWARVAMPPNRAAWKETRAAYEAAGAAGLVVPQDPRLLDLLRNPDREDDRSDLQLVQG